VRRVASTIVVTGLCLAGSTGVVAQTTSMLEDQATASAQSSPLVVITDSTCSYRLASLSAGVYMVRFAISGFQTKKSKRLPTLMARPS
jgi:hypothetical protein